MAFASSTSAFGMKPATTSIFGQQQQQPNTTSFANAAPLGQNNQQQGSAFGGAFGQQQNQQQQQPSANIFGQPQQQQPAAPTGLFGQTQPQQQQTTGTTGLFGQQQQQQQQNTGTTGLFGQPQQQQNTGTTGLFGQPQQNASTTNIFGQPQQQQNTGSTNIFGQPQQQQTTTTTNLFGQPQQQQNTTTTGLFGQQQQPQQQQPQTNLFGNSLFGSNANTNNNQQQQQQPAAPSNPFGGLFGNNNNNTGNQQQQQPQSTNLFGGSTTTNPLQAQPTLGASAFGGGNTGGTGLFGGGGGGLFGAKPQQPQQSNTQTPGAFGNSVAQPGINALQFPNGVPPFTKSTKFNDLPDEYKRLMENIDSFIQGRVQICKDLQQRKLGDEPVKGQDAIRQLNKELINTATTIRNDLHLTNDLKSKVDQAVEDTIVATRIIDGFRNPQSGNTYLKDHAAFPLEYFTRVTEQMKERLAWYQSTIEQIERKLASASSSTQTPQSISATLQAQHQIFLALANKTAAVDAELQKIKALYTQLWRSKTGSVRDPFNDIVKSSTAETAGDFGLGSLNFR
ncbi:hypothetical protein CPC08DRAFT_735374 [Agrocybe pediades]|nr:hypothetical protein CPC08DRAFT_735374 [Agrocybe pediades]